MPLKTVFSFKSNRPGDFRTFLPVDLQSSRVFSSLAKLSPISHPKMHHSNFGAKKNLGLFFNQSNFYSTFVVREAQDIRNERLEKIKALLEGEGKIKFTGGILTTYGLKGAKTVCEDVTQHVLKIAKASPQDAAHILRVLESKEFKWWVMSAEESMELWKETRYGCYLPSCNQFYLVYSRDELVRGCLARAIWQGMRSAWVLTHNTGGDPISVFKQISAPECSHYFAPGKGEHLPKIEQCLEIGFKRILELEKILKGKNENLSQEQKNSLVGYQAVADQHYAPEIWGGCFDQEQFRRLQIAEQIALYDEAQVMERFEMLGQSVELPIYIKKFIFGEDGYYYFNCRSTSWVEPHPLAALVRDILRRIMSYEELYDSVYQQEGMSSEARRHRRVEKFDTHVFEMGSECVKVFFPKLWEFYQEHGLIEKIEQDFDVELVSSPTPPR